MLLYMGLLSLFLVVLTDILVQTLESRTKSTAETFVTADDLFVRSRLAYDIRRASSIVTPANPGTTTQQLVLTIGGTTYTYARANGALTLTIGSGSQEALTTSDTRVAGFAVYRAGDGSTKDTLQLTYTLQSLATLRGVPAEQKTTAITIGAR